MNGTRWIGLIVLTLGILGLVYGGFTYTSDSHDADLGPIELELEEKDRVDVPLWLGIAATIVGAGLLVFGRGRRASLQR